MTGSGSTTRDDAGSQRDITRVDLSDQQRSGIEELLFRLADDEFVHAERLTEWQIFAPTLESDLALANIAQDEFGHARLWFDLLEQLGYDEAELIWERPPAKWTHSPLVERPFEDGDWADAVVRGYLYDVAERLRLEALLDTSYAPLADRIGKVLTEEEYHREHAESWLERLANDSAGQSRLQAAVDELFPVALTVFAPGPAEPTILEEGFRSESLPDLREQWLDITIPYLESLGVRVPDPPEDGVAGPTGRDGSHSEAWPKLHEEFTATYHELGIDTPTRIREEAGND